MGAFAVAKGYWIARLNVVDQERYEKYVAANGAVFEKFGARFLVRGGESETRRGAEHQRHVVLEFESLAQAKACYDSPEYQVILADRDAGADVDIVIVEGIAG